MRKNMNNLKQMQLRKLILHNTQHKNVNILRT